MSTFLCTQPDLLASEGEVEGGRAMERIFDGLLLRCLQLSFERALQNERPMLIGKQVLTRPEGADLCFPVPWSGGGGGGIWQSMDQVTSEMLQHSVPMSILLNTQLILAQ
ncbi:unnamed protein product [Caretta caretta]